MYYTDCPIKKLGDVPYKPAPVREVLIVSYDGDKYCKIFVEGILTEIKSGYIYTEKGRITEVPQISPEKLEYFKEVAND